MSTKVSIAFHNEYHLVTIRSPSLKSNPSSTWQDGGNGYHAVGNFGFWLGHPRRIGLVPSGIRAATRLKGLWWKSRRCSGNRRPRVTLSMRLWKICGKQGVFPGRTWDPSLNQILKYLLQWITYYLLGKKPVQPDPRGESRYKYK